jgi:DNA-binding beta-propeller fold protein YncE
MGAPVFGSPISGAGMKGGAWGAAISPTDGTVWIGSFGGSALSAYSAEGVPTSPDTGYTDGPLDHPQGLAIDQRGNVWIANNFGPESSPGEGNVIVYPGGDPTKAVTISGGGLNHPFAIQIDGQGRAWVTNAGLGGARLVNTRAAIAIGKFGGSVTVIGPDFEPTSFSPIEDPSFKWPLGLSIDAQGNAWVVNYFGSSVTQIGTDGEVAGNFPLPRGTLPWSEAVDGSDRVWVAGFGRPGVWLLCGANVEACPAGATTGSTLSPRAGFRSRAFQHFTSIQVDASGNVWLSNNWSKLLPPTGGTGLVQMIGAATPVCTPLGPVPIEPTGGGSCDRAWAAESSTTSPDGSTDSRRGWIVGGAVVVLALIVIGVVYVVTRRRNAPLNP